MEKLKTYVLGTAILMSIHNIFLWRNHKNIHCGYCNSNEHTQHIFYGETVKTFVVGTAIIMSTHNTYFYGETVKTCVVSIAIIMSTHNIRFCGWKYEKWSLKYSLILTFSVSLELELESLRLVMLLSLRTDRSEQTVQTQIKLLLEEQSDKGLHCSPFCLHLLDTLLYGKTTLSKF